jgi:hypothetical protein
VSGRNGLERLYGVLTPEERFAAILRASARGDEAERDRLVRAAPREHFAVPDCHGLQEGLLLLSLAQLGALAGWAALYWKAATARNQEDMPPSTEARLGKVARLFAYLFTAEERGWALFMAGLGAEDAEAPLRDVPGWSSLQFAAEGVREDAFSPEEAAAYLRESLGEQAQAVAERAEGVAEGLRAALAYWRGLWM